MLPRKDIPQNSQAQAESVEDDEVHSRKIVDEPSLPASPACRFEPIDEIDGVEEAAARDPPRMQFRAMAIARWVLPVPVPPTRTTLRCLSDEAAAGKIAYQAFVDWRILEGEVVDVFGERQLGDRGLVFDLARLCFSELSALSRLS